MRSLAGSVRGDGNFMLSGVRYPFRVSSGQSADGNGTRVHLNIDPGARALSVDLDGVLSFEARAPRFEGAMILAAPAGLRARSGDNDAAPWRISAKVKADPAAARLEQLEASYGAEETALKFSGLGDLRLGASPLLHAVLSARQLDADRFAAKDKDGSAAEPIRLLPALRALMAGDPAASDPDANRVQLRADHAGRASGAEFCRRAAGRDQILDDRPAGFSRAGRDPRRFSGTNAQTGPSDRFTGALRSSRRIRMRWWRGCRAAARSPIAARSRCA